MTKPVNLKKMKELKYIKIAHELNTELAGKLAAQEFHFRGNLNSFSLISLSKGTPEMGYSGLQTKETGKKRFNEAIHLEGFKPRTLTNGKKGKNPEKELQAWIIKHALSNDLKLPFDPSIKFLCSELSLKMKDGKRAVNDVLGIDVSGNLVIIELKTDRHKKRLTEQVNNFEEAIVLNEEFFKKLVKVFLPSEEWSGKIKKIVIWPALDSGKMISWKDGIREITYKQIEKKREN